MGHRGLLIVVALLWLPAVQLPASKQVLQLDLERSRVRFQLGAVLHSVSGQVPLIGGRLVVDPVRGLASGRVVLDATRAQTGHDGRDRKMHREVLESERFPLVVFEPSRLTLSDTAGSPSFELSGTVAIHGDRHSLTLAGSFTQSGDDIVATGTTEVPYVAWGMKNPSRLLFRVSKQVRVHVVAVGRLGRADASEAP